MKHSAGSEIDRKDLGEAERDCPVCSGRSYRLWGRVGAYSIVRCAACGMGLTSPFPAVAEMLSVNDETYEVSQRIATYLSRREYLEKRYWTQLDKIKKFRADGKMLDVGCNIGLFLNVARTAGFDAVGVEMNQTCADYGIRSFGLEIHTGFLEDARFEESTFDVVTMFDVLEHIPNLTGILQEVRRVLKPGGLLVVQSPNLNSVMAGLTRSRWSWLSPPDHLYHFTPETLTRLLGSNRFRIEQCATWEPAADFSNNLIAAYFPGSLLGAVRKIARLSGMFLLPVLVLQKLWWRALRGGLVEMYAVKTETVVRTPAERV